MLILPPSPGMLTHAKKITLRMRLGPNDLILDVTLSHFNDLGKAMSFSALGKI